MRVTWRVTRRVSGARRCERLARFGAAAGRLWTEDSPDTGFAGGTVAAPCTARGVPAPKLAAGEVTATVPARPAPAARPMPARAIRDRRRGGMLGSSDADRRRGGRVELRAPARGARKRAPRRWRALLMDWSRSRGRRRPGAPRDSRTATIGGRRPERAGPGNRRCTVAGRTSPTFRCVPRSGAPGSGRIWWWPRLRTTVRAAAAPRQPLRARLRRRICICAGPEGVARGPG